MLVTYLGQNTKVIEYHCSVSAVELNCSTFSYSERHEVLLYRFCKGSRIPSEENGNVRASQRAIYHYGLLFTFTLLLGTLKCCNGQVVGGK